MREFDAAALPVFRRISRTLTASVLPHEIEPLRAWAFKTMLVRSLQDRSAGLEAPTHWFREFHQTGGGIPAAVIQYIAFPQYRTNALSNTVVMVDSDLGAPLRVHETCITFDRLSIVTLAMDTEPADAVETYRALLQQYEAAFSEVLVRLEGDREIGPDAILPMPWLDLIRTPTEATQGPSEFHVGPFPYEVPGP